MSATDSDGIAGFQGAADSLYTVVAEPVLYSRRAYAYGRRQWEGERWKDY